MTSARLQAAQPTPYAPLGFHEAIQEKREAAIEWIDRDTQSKRAPLDEAYHQRHRRFSKAAWRTKAR